MAFLKVAATIACLLAPLAAATAQAPATATSAASPVAVQQMTTGEPGMALVIWHPAALSLEAPRPGTGTDTDRPRFPLVIVSHGTGAGPRAHVDTAEALAGAGFVVVAPMHRGDNFQDDSQVGRPQWMASRSRDVGEAIDFMLEQWPGRSSLDPRRVGIFGFSAGATTALIVAGGVPDLGRLAPHCVANPEFVCNLVPPQAEAAGATPAWAHDRRIAAAVLAAPGLGFLFEPAGLAGVAAPVQLWVGSEDDIVPYAGNAAVIRRLLPGSTEFHRVDGAAHLSFLAPCTGGEPPQLCQDPPGFDRAAFHRRFGQAVTAFFRRHLPDPSSYDVRVP